MARGPDLAYGAQLSAPWISDQPHLLHVACAGPDPMCYLGCAQAYLAPYATLGGSMAQAYLSPLLWWVQPTTFLTGLPQTGKGANRLLRTNNKKNKKTQTGGSADPRFKMRVPRRDAK